MSDIDVVCAVVRFDSDAGAVLDAIYPDTSNDSTRAWIIPLLPSYALPDGVHRQSLDFVYFVAHPPEPNGNHLNGVSCFKQTTSSELTRGCLQQSLVMALIQPDDATIPVAIFETMQILLARHARQFFEGDHSSTATVLQRLHEQAVFDQEDRSSFAPTLRRLLLSAPESFLVIVKALDAGASIILFSEASLHNLTSTVLALKTVMAGPTTVLPYLPIYALEPTLNRSKHVLLGTNNKFIWLNRTGANVLFNIDTAELRIEEGPWCDIVRLSQADRRFASCLVAPENIDHAREHILDYRRRARGVIARQLRMEREHPARGALVDEIPANEHNSMDSMLLDWNSIWLGIMFGFVKGDIDIDDNDDIPLHPCHDDNDGLGLDAIWTTTKSLGDQAQRGLTRASTAVSSWIGSLAQSLSPPE